MSKRSMRKKYFKKHIPSQGLNIMCRSGDKEYQIAVMRWSDGLNKDVEKAIDNDADKIIDALNGLRVLLNVITEQAETGIDSLCVTNNHITKAAFERIIKICDREREGEPLIIIGEQTIKERK